VHFITRLSHHSQSAQAIDIVSINYKDLEKLRGEATEGAIMGFTGKQIIHPSQVCGYA
jgi:citrate lyase subunit beta-like protein